jgi:hypothetical protein
MPEIAGTMPDPKSRARVSALRKAAVPTMPSLEEQKKKAAPVLEGWRSWLPVAVGVALACAAPQLRDLLTPYQPWGMQAIFPFVLFVGRHELGLSDELTRTLPQLMLLLQFPLEGLLTRFNLSKGVPLGKALGQIAFLHAVCFLVLWLVGGAAQ